MTPPPPKGRPRGGLMTKKNKKKKINFLAPPCLKEAKVGVYHILAIFYDSV